MEFLASGQVEASQGELGLSWIALHVNYCRSFVPFFYFVRQCYFYFIALIEVRSVKLLMLQKIVIVVYLHHYWILMVPVIVLVLMALDSVSTILSSICYSFMYCLVVVVFFFDKLNGISSAKNFHLSPSQQATPCSNRNQTFFFFVFVLLLDFIYSACVLRKILF